MNRSMMPRGVSFWSSQSAELNGILRFSTGTSMGKPKTHGPVSMTALLRGMVAESSPT